LNGVIFNSMIKYILAIILFLLNSPACAQFTTLIQWQEAKTANSGDTISYDSNRKLNWSDFQGRPDANSPAAAITESGFGYRMSLQTVNNRTNMIITVFCYFNKKKSWVKAGMKTNYALLHEQHHFDITYINTCLFIQKLKAAHFTVQNYASLVNKIHDECFAELDKMQDEYDGQTKNGRISREQSAWNKKIDQLLESITTN